MTGAALAAAYARDVVGPLLDDGAPGVPVSLARLGSGSDVLGLDDTTSRDHDWGLRVTVLVPEDEIDRIDALLESRLPDEFRGHPARFPVTWDGRRHHRAEVASILGFARSRTGLDLSRDLDTIDWLSLTGQSALELAAGRVFRDDDGRLVRVRERLASYPSDIALQVLAGAWHAVGQELPFITRTGDRGDEAGSRVLTARLVGIAMRIGFLLERRWAPYPKWLGTAFRRLPRVGGLSAPLRRALAAASARAREDALVAALDGLARVQRESGLPTLEPATEPFWGRPARGLRAIPDVLRQAIDDPAIRALPLLGSPEIWSSSADVLMDVDRRVRATRALYGPVT